MLTRRALFQSALQSAAAPAILRGARRAGDKPNLLFLWTDEQRADTMAAYGNTSYRVPNMNRLGAQSVVFERAYVTQPVCTPSRSSVMTGLWPHQSGLIRNNIPLRPDQKTLPELLDDSAYRTGYFGKWHLGDEIFPQHGFAEWQAIEDGIYRNHYSAGRSREGRSQYHHFLVRNGYQPDSRQQDFSRNFCTKLPIEHTKPAFLANVASRFILNHRAEPWMLYVNFLEPHMPFSSVLNDLHSEADAPLPANYPGIPTGSEPEWYKRRRAAQTAPKGSEGQRLDSRAGWQRLVRNYAGLCSLVDQALGRILWALEASGAMDNTIIVYTSDHGDMMGSHTLYAKQVMYEEACRVPLLLRVPFRRQQPLRHERPVSHIDLVPTLLDLLGKPAAAAGLSGTSLVPALERRDTQPRDVFIEWTRESDAEGPNARCVITPDRRKLVLQDSDASLYFDHARDPLEMNNQFGKADTSPLRAKIAAWQKQTNDTRYTL